MVIIIIFGLNKLSLNLITKKIIFMITKLIVALLLIAVLNASYIPEMFLATSADFFNKQVSLNGGPIINQFIQNFKAPNVTYDNTVNLIHVKLNLTNITQKVDINWHTNILNVTGDRSFAIHARNINVTLKVDYFEYHIVLERISQHGELDIHLQNIDVLTKISFVRNNCQRGIGFGIFVNDIIMDPTKLKINIVFRNKSGKQIDKKIIAILQKLVLSRAPNIINTQVRDSLNEQLHNATCNNMIEHVSPIGTEQYVISLNTTDVPYFAEMKFLTIPVDINFKNIKNNETNEQTSNENLVDHHLYEKQANVTATISSNMIDTLVWLVDDSNYLSAVITKDTLGPDAPIALDTTGLSILMPGLKKYPNKDVVIRVNTSSEFSQVFIRSGRILSGISVSAQFIINDTSRIHDVDKCINQRECIVATTLNITLGVSASVRVQKLNYLTGLVQALYIHQIKVINSIIDVKVPNLMKILNPLISSARPQINNMLQQGMELNITAIQPLKKFNITGIIAETFLDYASLGIRFDL